jgi:hypothetical protein
MFGSRVRFPATSDVMANFEGSFTNISICTFNGCYDVSLKMLQFITFANNAFVCTWDCFLKSGNITHKGSGIVNPKCR